MIYTKTAKTIRVQLMTFRDGLQSLFGGKVRVEDILPAMKAAAAAGIFITDEEVDAYMQVMVEENGGQEAFEAKLAEWGETYDDAWREVRAELIGMTMTQRIIESVPTVAEHVHARHILVDTLEEAERIYAQLLAGADFATLAKEYSQDPNTRETGGDPGAAGPGLPGR